MCHKRKNVTCAIISPIHRGSHLSRSSSKVMVLFFNMFGCSYAYELAKTLTGMGSRGHLLLPLRSRYGPWTPPLSHHTSRQWHAGYCGRGNGLPPTWWGGPAGAGYGHCLHGRDEPSLGLQEGTSLVGAERGGIGRPIGPWRSSRWTRVTHARHSDPANAAVSS